MTCVIGFVHNQRIRRIRIIRGVSWQNTKSPEAGQFGAAVTAQYILVRPTVEGSYSDLLFGVEQVLKPLNGAGWMKISIA